MKNKPTGRDSDQFTLRFPNGMRSKIKKIAGRNRRSMNSELIFLIERGMQATHIESGTTAFDTQEGAA